MNLLTINSYDCSPVASGGVNRITDILSRQFGIRGVGCFFGFFESLPKGIELTPFLDRIQLDRNLDRAAFKSFLLKNKIDIVQINFLKKHNLSTIPLIYSISHECGAKVIYAFHMCPGFQTVTYGSLRMIRYCVSSRTNVLPEIKKYILTLLRPVVKILEPVVLRGKYRTPYENCDKIVTLSANYFAPYMRLAGIRDSSKFLAIPNGLRFSQSACSEDILNKQPIVLTVARLEEDTKRLSLVLKAWKQIESDNRFNLWTLQFVGDGRDKGFYRSLVEEYHLKRVEFTGQQNPQEYYRKASVFLMTSSAEGWPLVLLEAMQMGVPVVAMNTFGSLYDIVDDGKNGSISSGNLDNFVHCMTNLMSNNDLRVKMSCSAVEKSQSFSTRIIVDKWLDLFKSLVPDSEFKSML